MGLQIEQRIAARLHQRGLPTVAVDADSDLFPRVLDGRHRRRRVAARHLVERGHRRFGYLLEQQVTDYESQAVKRLAGFREVIDSTGSDREVMVASSPNRWTVHARRHPSCSTDRILPRPSWPTTICWLSGSSWPPGIADFGCRKTLR